MPPSRHFHATGRPCHDVTHRPVAGKLRGRVCKIHEAAVARGSREGGRFYICLLLVARGCLLLARGCWLIARGCLLLAGGPWLLVGCRLQIACGYWFWHWLPRPPAIGRCNRREAQGNGRKAIGQGNWRLATSKWRTAKGNWQLAAGNRQMQPAVTGTGSARVHVPSSQKKAPMFSHRGFCQLTRRRPTLPHS